MRSKKLFNPMVATLLFMAFGTVFSQAALAQHCPYDGAYGRNVSYNRYGTGLQTRRSGLSSLSINRRSNQYHGNTYRRAYRNGGYGGGFFVRGY